MSTKDIMLKLVHDIEGKIRICNGRHTTMFDGYGRLIDRIDLGDALDDLAELRYLIVKSEVL